MCFLNADYPWHYFPLLTCKGSPTFKISNILRLWPQTGTFLNWLLIVVDGKLGMDVSGEEKKVTRCRAPYWNPCRPSAGLQLQAWYHSKPFLSYLQMPFRVLFPESRDYNCVWIFTFSNPFLKTKWGLPCAVWMSGGGKGPSNYQLQPVWVGTGHPAGEGKKRWGWTELPSFYLFCKPAHESHFDLNCVSFFIVGEKQKVKRTPR